MAIGSGLGMPQNRAQLYGALIDAGLQPPSSVMTDFKQTPGFDEAVALFKTSTPPYQPALQGIKTAIHSLPSDKARELFWKETLPILYSDIIESLGDRQGRLRMGLGNNANLPALLLGKELDGCHEEKPDPHLSDRIAAKVLHLDTDYAAGIIMLHFNQSIGRQRLAGRAELFDGDKRFILAVAGAQGIRQSLVRNGSPLVAWLDRQGAVRPSSPTTEVPRKTLQA